MGRLHVARTSQPQGSGTIDPGVQSALGITVAWVGSVPTRSLVTGGVATGSSTIGRVATQKGLAASFTNTIGERIDVSPSADYVLGKPQTTIAILRRCRDTTARTAEVFSYDAGLGNRCLAHAPYSDGNLYWDFGDSTAGSGRASVPYTKDTDWETLVFLADPVRGREVWRRGVRILSDTSATVARTSSSAPFGIGSDSTSDPTITGDSVDVALFVVSKMAWSPQQIVSWSSNPWPGFAPLQRNIWVPVSAGGSSGTLSVTSAADTNEAAGATTVTGSSEKTAAADTSAASGSTTIVGSVAKTGGADTCVSSGEVGGVEATGTVSRTNAADTSAASGAPTISGVVARTSRADTAQASGIAGHAAVGRRRRFLVQTKTGELEVDSLADAVRLIKQAKAKLQTKENPVVTMAGIKVAVSLKPKMDYKAIEARMRAQIQAEIDDEEELLTLFL